MRERLQEYALIAEVLGGVAVIVTLIFLVIETRANTQAIQAQTRDSMSKNLMDWYADIYGDEYTADVFSKGRFGGVSEAGDISDQSAFRFIVFANFRMWENEYYQYRKGLFEEDEFGARSAQWPGISQLPGYQELWESTKTAYSPEFVEYLDSRISEIGN